MKGNSIERVGSPGIVCREDGDCDELDLKLSRAWLRIAVAGFFAGQGMVFSLALNMTPPPFESAAYWVLHGGLILSSLIVMFFLGGPLFVSTLGMLRGRRLSIEGLFTLSLLGAFTGSVVGSITGQGGVYYEIVAIVIAIYTFGRMLGERSQAKLRLESARLQERFDEAQVCADSGRWTTLGVADVPLGARVRVEPGAPFTVDGILQSGVGYIQETALSGEPLPVVRRPGDKVRAGTWAIDSRFELEVTHSGGQRELDRILRTVTSGDGRSSELQTQANELTQRFLPVVVGVSLGTAFFWAVAGTWIDAALNSMAVLLVACPCALGLATPVAISQGLYRLARLGLVSRNGALIDALARTKQIFFDKTGTLSESSLRVSEFYVAPDCAVPQADWMRGLYDAEAGLSHPVARALCQYLRAGVFQEMPEPAASASIENLRLIGGQGIAFEWLREEHRYALKVGEAGLRSDEASVAQLVEGLHERKGRRIFVFLEGKAVACFVLQERMRGGVAEVWQQLDALGIEAHILTGDPAPEMELPASVRMEQGLSSDQKQGLVRAARDARGEPLFVGDGINDTEAMIRASGSIAMHSGTALARSVAMGELSNDRIEVIPEAVILARRIHQRLRGNLKYAAAYNVLGMALAAAGWLHPVAAALIMLVSSFWVTTRALR